LKRTLHKAYVFLTITLVSIVQSQTPSIPVLPLEDWSDAQPNVYYKDLENQLDPFEGTWLYTDNDTSWKIILKKETMFFNGNYYEDLIGGEYQYIKNSVELINTLSNIETVEGWNHRIDGNAIINDCDYLPPTDCVDGEDRLEVTITDPVTGHAGAVYFRARTVNGQDVLLAYVIFDQKSSYNGLTQPKPEPSMPWQQEYTLIKQ